MAIGESFLFSRIRGSVGDITYQQNQFHAIVLKSKIINPAYPDTTGQQNLKAAFDYAITSWTGLSDAERTEWDNYAKTFSPGLSYRPRAISGRYEFLKTISLAKFLNLRYGLFSSIDFSAPVGYDHLQIPNFIPDVYTGGGSQGAAYQVVNPNSRLLHLYSVRSAPYNLARNRLSGPFLYSQAYYDTVTANATTYLGRSLPSTYLNKCLFIKFSFITTSAPYQTCKKIIWRAVVNTP